MEKICWSNSIAFNVLMFARVYTMVNPEVWGFFTHVQVFDNNPVKFGAQFHNQVFTLSVNPNNCWPNFE